MRRAAAATAAVAAARASRVPAACDVNRASSLAQKARDKTVVAPAAAAAAAAAAAVPAAGPLRVEEFTPSMLEQRVLDVVAERGRKGTDKCARHGLI